MKQSQVQPLFIDSGDAPIDSGMKIFYRAQIAHLPHVTFDYSSRVTYSLSVYYECYAFHHATDTGFWVRGRNGHIDKQGKYREALCFVQNNQDFDYDKPNGRIGFVHSTKALARLALAYRIRRAFTNAEVRMVQEHTNAENLSQKYPELLPVLGDILAPKKAQEPEAL